ncbi:MAG: arylesterase [Steroidobacteraceae bacterium]|nr:arylesterase [Steroidobacteraceae bacterium]
MVNIPSGLVTFFVRLSALSTLIRFIQLALVLAFVGTAAAEQPQRTIIVLGDSLSAGYGVKVQEGWVSLLAKRLASEGYGYRVVNASVSGETTQGGLARLPRALQTHKPAIVIVELGGNDGLRGLPLAASRENLRKTIELSLAARAQVVLVGMVIPPNYGQRYGQEFRDMFATLAKKQSLAFVPFFLDNVALEPKLMQADGIHPNAAGQPQMLENLWPKLKPLLVAPGKP